MLASLDALNESMSESRQLYIFPSIWTLFTPWVCFWFPCSVLFSLLKNIINIILNVINFTTWIVNEHSFCNLHPQPVGDSGNLSQSHLWTSGCLTGSEAAWVTGVTGDLWDWKNADKNQICKLCKVLQSCALGSTCTRLCLTRFWQWLRYHHCSHPWQHRPKWKTKMKMKIRYE